MGPYCRQVNSSATAGTATRKIARTKHGPARIRPRLFPPLQLVSQFAVGSHFGLSPARGFIEACSARARPCRQPEPIVSLLPKPGDHDVVELAAIAFTLV